MALLKRGLSWLFLLPWLPAPGAGGFLIRNVRLEKCLHASPHGAEKVGLADCRRHSLQQQWAWDAATRALVSRKTGQCLAVSQELLLARLEDCADREHQAWACSPRGHLTLRALGLHLSTEPGGHAALLSAEKSKFSRWKTETDGLVCAADAPAAPGPGDRVEESAGTLAWGPDSDPVPATEMHILSVEAPASAWGDGRGFTSALPRNNNGDASWEADHEKRAQHKGHQGKTASSRRPGTKWKTVMLVLCPLAFILGVIILMVNIHYSKKKKMLSALKSRQVSYRQQLHVPGRVADCAKTQIIPASSSPLPKHGEILIEWKDGTITALFDDTNSQIC